MNPKILIIGYGRHGKDTMAEILKENFHFSFQSSSEASSRIFIYDLLKDKYGYKDENECFKDRSTKRVEWFNLINEYNSEDENKLAKEILKESDCYVGMREKRQIVKAKHSKLFDLIVWVDACGRLPKEGEDSMNITSDDADIIITNNGDYDSFKLKVINFGKLIYGSKDEIIFKTEDGCYIKLSELPTNVYACRKEPYSDETPQVYVITDLNSIKLIGTRKVIFFYEQSCLDYISQY